MKFNLDEREVKIIQLALSHYIIEHKNSKVMKDYIEDAKILLDNINFYKKQQNEE